MAVLVEGAKTAAQVRGWHRIVKAVTAHLNQHLGDGEPPRHETQVEEWLRTHFLGWEATDLSPRHISSSSKRQMSEALSRLEVWAAEQGIDLSHDERNHA